MSLVVRSRMPLSRTSLLACALGLVLSGSVGAQADIWVIWDEADQAGTQSHDSCPAGLPLAAHTRCLYLRIAL